MKKCFVELAIDPNNEVQKREFGNRWRNGSTTLILRPMLPIGGYWDSDRQSDIDSAGGSENAIYKISYFSSELEALTRDQAGWETKHLILNGFAIMVGETGNGTFNFRNRDWDINWQVIRFE